LKTRPERIAFSIGIIQFLHLDDSRSLWILIGKPIL